MNHFQPRIYWKTIQQKSCSEGGKNNSADNKFTETKLNVTYIATACIF